MASPEVFVDTSGLYALIDGKDSHHPAAANVVGSLLRSNHRLVLSDYIVSETVTLARARSGAHVALRILDLLDQSGGIRIEFIGPARFDAARRFFRRHADHGYSFTDCSSFVLMRELGMKRALTSDRHFKEAGFEALLSLV
jgi:uncharacterized protein